MAAAARRLEPSSARNHPQDRPVQPHNGTVSWMSEVMHDDAGFSSTTLSMQLVRQGNLCWLDLCLLLVNA